MKISHYAVKHPVVIAMILIALVAFGFYCVFGLNFEFLPDINMPEVEILTVYPGASAGEVEKDITNILEDDFATLPNYKSMNSTSANSLSWVTIVFQDEVDPYEQLEDIRYRVDNLMSKLPQDAEKPISFVGGATMLPIMEFAVFGGEDTERITKYINETLKPRITRIDGVADVTLIGSAEPEIQIKLRMNDIESKGISVLQVYQVLNYGDFSVPLGHADYNSKTISVSYDGGIDDIEQLKMLPVGMGEDNVMIRLQDVADVSYTRAKSENFVMSESGNMIMVSVTKRASGNSVKITREIKKVLANLENDTDGALNYKVYKDDSKSIKSSLVTVLDSGILGVVIAVIIIYLFLNNSKATFVIGVSIPLSFLFTFIGMKLIGATINLMTTAAFVVALGMIVDGSIVMLEQSSRYLGKPGFDSNHAIFKGSDEVGASIVASVLTTVVVFLPICFLKGIMGMILTGFAQVLILCMVASMLVSIVIIPFLIKVIMTKDYKEPKKTWFMRQYDKLEGAYKKAIKWSLDHKLYVIILPVILLVLSGGLVVGLGYSFIPSVDTGEFYVYADFPNGYTIERTKEKMNLAAQLLRENIPETDAIAVYVGMSDAMGDSMSDHPNKGYIYVMLKNKNRRSVHDLILLTQEVLSANIPDASINVANGGFDKLVGYISDGGGYSIEFVGSDINQIYDYAVKVRDFLKNDPDVLSTSMSTNFDELLLSMKMNHDQLNSLGITSYEAGMVPAILFNGTDVGSLTASNGDRINIHLTSDLLDDGVDSHLLDRINISTLAGSMVKLSDLGDIVLDNTVSSIQHSERNISIKVTTTLVSADTSGVNDRMNEWLKNNPLPSGVNTQSAGIMGLIMDSIGSMSIAVIIAIFLVYMVMVIQFERFKQPFIIMGSVPFCLIGVIVSFLVFGSQMTIMGAISIIALAGIVVNNAIILVDYINQIREGKRAEILKQDVDDVRYVFLDTKTELEILRTSTEEGGSSRLRPILMTTLTTLFGVFPMALATGEGAELYASVGQAIAGGLTTSTLITLFIIPVLYYTFEAREIKKKTEFIK